MRILIKEKMDRQLAGQSTYTPVMSIQEGYGNNKMTMSYDIQNMLDNKIDLDWVVVIDTEDQIIEIELSMDKL